MLPLQGSWDWSLVQELGFWQAELHSQLKERKRLFRRENQLPLCQAPSNCLSLRTGPHSLGNGAHSDDSQDPEQWWAQTWNYFGQESSGQEVGQGRGRSHLIQGSSTSYAKSCEPHLESWPGFGSSIHVLKYSMYILTVLKMELPLNYPWQWDVQDHQQNSNSVLIGSALKEVFCPRMFP